VNPQNWVVHGFQGEEVNRDADVVHKGARHVALRDGLWLQPEPLLYLGLTNGNLASPIGYTGVYAAGDTNHLSDPGGYASVALQLGGLMAGHDVGADPVGAARDVNTWLNAGSIVAAGNAAWGTGVTFVAFAVDAASTSLVAAAAGPTGQALMNEVLELGDDLAGGMGTLRARASRTLPANSLTAAEAGQIQGIANKYGTNVDVVGSRAAGAGRNINSPELPVTLADGTKGPRSDIDFRFDTAHPRAGELAEELNQVGNGAGSARMDKSNNPMVEGGRDSYPPFIRFGPE
jgi:hypothetical protein